MHSGAVEYSQILSQGGPPLTPFLVNKSTEDKMSNIVMIAKRTPKLSITKLFQNHYRKCQQHSRWQV